MVRVKCALVRNSFGEIKIDKKPGARFKRIDPIDAMIDAHALALIQRRPEEKVDLDVRYLSIWMQWDGPQRSDAN